MSTPRRITSGIAIVVWAVLAACSAEAQFSELLQRVPPSVNTMVLLNAEKLLDSDIAVREGWRKDFERAVARGLTRLPRDAQQYVLAAQTDFTTMYPVWQLGVLSTADKHDMVYIAQKRDGRRDTISELDVVLLPSENYLVQLDARTYGSLVPASRQAVSRWIKTTSTDTAEFSPYIQEAIGYAEDSGTEIIMAMDFTDALDPADVHEWVRESEVMADAGIDVEAATESLVSLRGAMLGITFGAKPFGSVKVDFGQDISVLENVARKLLIDALAKRGAMIDDFSQWSGQVGEKDLRISGNLSDDGLRKILSLIDAPTATSLAINEAEDEATQSQNEHNSTVTATRTYFTSVNQYFRDLQDKNARTIAQYGVWFNRYAQKIDQLPLLNVDKEMLNYGHYVAQQFRNAAAAIQGIGIRQRVRQVENVNAAGVPGYWGSAYDGGYSYDGYYYRGTYGFTPRGDVQQAELRQQQQARTKVNVQEKARGASAARAIMRDVQNATSMIRRKMTERYQVEFGGS